MTFFIYAFSTLSINEIWRGRRNPEVPLCVCVCVAMQDALTDMRMALGEHSNSAGDLHNKDQCRPALTERERELLTQDVQQ